MKYAALLAALLALTACDVEDPPCGAEGAECCATCNGSPCLPVRTCDEGLTCTMTVNVETDERDFVCLAAP